MHEDAGTYCAAVRPYDVPVGENDPVRYETNRRHESVHRREGRLTSWKATDGLITPSSKVFV